MYSEKPFKAALDSKENGNMSVLISESKKLRMTKNSCGVFNPHGIGQCRGNFDEPKANLTNVLN